MTKYLRVDIEGCVIGCCNDPTYEALDADTYTDDELLTLGQDVANEQHSWGCAVVDEVDVPESHR
ncbi:hypothetical protein ACWD2L_06025 [Streptomyces sp. NPDC002754]